MELGLIYSFKCNARCKHCGFACGPQKRHKMALEDAFKIIREASEIPRIRKIVFTGGEPLLFYNEIRKLVSFTAKLGLFPRVVTNAFWATNPERAKEIIKGLVDAGLTSVNISADTYHQEFVPKKNIATAVEIFQKYKITCVIARTLTPGDSSLEEFIKSYHLPIERCLSINEFEKKFRFRSVYDMNPSQNIIILESPLTLSGGRARSLAHKCSYLDINSFSDAGCYEIIDKPGVYPNGLLVACCCPAKDQQKLIVGNVLKESLQKCYTSMEKNILYKYLYNYGPVTLYKKVIRGKTTLPFRKFNSTCDVCLELLKRANEKRLYQVVRQKDAEEFIGKFLSIIGKYQSESR